MEGHGLSEQSFMNNEDILDYLAHVADGIDTELNVDYVCVHSMHRNP